MGIILLIYFLNLLKIKVKMKKYLIVLLLVITFSFVLIGRVNAQTITPSITPAEAIPEACGIGCPITNTTNAPNITPYVCAPNYQQWLQNKSSNYWVKDPEITALGKAGERSRQFLNWVLTHRSIDNHPVILSVWNTSRNITYFLLILVVVIMGLGIIIGRKYNYFTKIEIWPLILKIGLLFLFATFSALIVLLVIQLSDTLMLFFTETMKVNKLFNIFFIKNPTGITINDSEQSYLGFQGCSNLNVDILESLRTSKFLINLTNMTYYFIGIMFIIRKIVLWFLLIVSPFLAILIPFIMIRNTGWIWIGVFFQWVFYGPLFTLFLGAMATIWNASSHIPYNFDFSRTFSLDGFIYQTATNIFYGGPGQKLGFMNSANYVDTFAEYIIALVMLWIAVILPWLLLRIFRDYCCEGIYAMKNILYSIYDQLRGGPQSPSPMLPPSLTSAIGQALKIPREVETSVKVKLETTEQIRQATTEQVVRSLDIHVSKLTDVANFETNKTSQETIRRNLEYLANPTKAETPTERQRFMNIRTELFNRAIKEDRVAKQVLSSVSTSTVEKIQKQKEILQSMPQSESLAKIASIQVQIPQEKVVTTMSSIFNTVTTDNNFMNQISQTTQQPVNQVQSVINAFTNNLSQPATNIITNITKQTNIPKENVVKILGNIISSFQLLNTINNSAQKGQISEEKIVRIVDNLPSIMIHNIANQTQLTETEIKNVVSNIIKNINESPETIINNVTNNTAVTKEKVSQVFKTIHDNLVSTKEIISKISEKEKVSEDQVLKLIETQQPLLLKSEKNIEQTVTIPSTISIEDYEQVKKMWIKQYEKGEVPLTENITSREQWVDQDIVFITNTMNKLLSSDVQLKQEGLDDLGYILPIFLINNLKGDELVVYLKAKLEAAKTTKEMFDKEKEIEEKVKAKDEEQKVTVERPKEEVAEKTLEMSKEINRPS